MTNENQSIPISRFRATYRGETLGWYDTADEAQAAIDRASEEEAREELELRKEVLGY